jgi:hypothetical protein
VADKERARTGVQSRALSGTLGLASELCRLVENAFDFAAVDVEFAAAFRRQGGLTASPSDTPPLVHRRRADPQRSGDLPGVRIVLEHLRGLQPQLLAAGLGVHGQPAAIRITHDTGLNPDHRQSRRRADRH